MQLRPHPRHLPHRGRGLLQQGQQLQREKHDPEFSVPLPQAGETELGFQEDIVFLAPTVRQSLITLLFSECFLSHPKVVLKSS